MKIQSYFEKRLAAYGTMSLALAAASQASGATIITFLDPGVSDAASPIYINLAQGTVDATPVAGDYELLLDEGSSARIEVYQGSMFNASRMPKFAVSALDFPESSQASSAARLSFGGSIGPGLKFSAVFGTLAEQSVHASSDSNFSGPFGHFNPAFGDVSGYLGLEIFPGGTPEYGWANIVVHTDYSITLNGFALQTSGAGLDPETGGDDTGQTPEPSSILLLAIGAAGIVTYRRKRGTP